MKKVVIVLVFFILAYGSCFAQNANSERRIIGTWADNAGRTWVFNANGNLTVDGNQYRFGVTNTHLAIVERTGLATYEISISSDGNSIILINRTDNTPNFPSGSFLLTKR